MVLVVTKVCERLLSWYLLLRMCEGCFCAGTGGYECVRVLLRLYWLLRIGGATELVLAATHMGGALLTWHWLLRMCEGRV